MPIWQRQQVHLREKFDDDNFILKHMGPGILSMAYAGPNMNGSKFFICAAQTEWWNGKQVVLGKVKEGMNIVETMERPPPFPISFQKLEFLKLDPARCSSPDTAHLPPSAHPRHRQDLRDLRNSLFRSVWS
ncbi:hypothetical protein CB1_001413021 [Camelus ferus]|nr:hypothetical protein CB1_001413021 [Camelus ferus]